MKAGFTLIELSIVLVIIGLIVGGIIGGADLIEAARIRAQVSQIENYFTAVHTFKLKYGNLPGDIPDPDATSFGFVPRGGYPGEGDGNGLIEGNVYNQNWGWVQGAGETLVFWVDLSTAGLIPGGFTAGCEDGNNCAWGSPTQSTLDVYFPQAKIGGGNYMYVWSGGLSHTDGKNYLGLSAITAVNSQYGCDFCLVSNPGLSVIAAYNIDNKIDDGFPQTGTVTAVYLNAQVALQAGSTWASGGGVSGTPDTTATRGSPTTCYDNNDMGGNTQQYSVGQSNGAGLNCALSFVFQ